MTWSITSGPGSIVGATTGTLVTVKGNSTGTIVLRAPCGVQFTLVSVATLADFSGDFWETPMDSPQCSQFPGDEFCDPVGLFSGTGAFEINYVNTLTGIGGNVGQDISGVTDPKGIAIAAATEKANSRTLAHELGQALGIGANSGTQDLHLMGEHKSEFKADLRLSECQTVATKNVSSSQ